MAHYSLIVRHALEVREYLFTTKEIAILSIEVTYSTMENPPTIHQDEAGNIWVWKDDKPIKDGDPEIFGQWHHAPIHDRPEHL